MGPVKWPIATGTGYRAVSIFVCFFLLFTTLNTISSTLSSTDSRLCSTFDCLDCASSRAQQPSSRGCNSWMARNRSLDCRVRTAISVLGCKPKANELSYGSSLFSKTNKKKNVCTVIATTKLWWRAVTKLWSPNHNLSLACYVCVTVCVCVIVSIYFNRCVNSLYAMHGCNVCIYACVIMSIYCVGWPCWRGWHILLKKQFIFIFINTYIKIPIILIYTFLPILV